MLRFDKVSCVFLLFYVLMKDIILYAYEYSDAIKLPKFYPPPLPPWWAGITDQVIFGWRKKSIKS